MAIVALPDDISLGTIVACAICGEEKPLHAMTAGVLKADGQQAFACESHRIERSNWTLGWLTVQHQLPLSPAHQTQTRIAHV